MKHLVIIITGLFVSFSLFAQSGHWRKINTPTQKKLLSVHFSNEEIGYAVGVDSLIMKTTDSGEHWQILNYTGIQFANNIDDLVDVFFVNDSVGFTIVSNHENRIYKGKLYKTIDGGMSWSPVNHGQNIAPYTCHFIEEDYGFLAGSAFFTGNVMTRNSFGVWGDYHYYQSSPDQFINTIDFINLQKGAMGGDGGMIYTTMDSGKTWLADTVKVHGNNIDSSINSLTFLNDSTIIISTSLGTLPILYSTDFGVTWNDAMSLVSFFYPIKTGVTVSTSDSIVASGRRDFNNGNIMGFISWLQNGNWQEDYTVEGLNDVANQTPANVFIVGDTGAIYTNKPLSSTSVGFTKKNEELKVYPNPAKNILHIEFLNHQTILSATLYDLQGRAIKTIEKPTTQLSVMDVPGGLYLLKITTDKKIISEKILLE